MDNSNWLSEHLDINQIQLLADFVRAIARRNPEETLMDNLIDIMKENFADKDDLEIVKDTKASQEIVVTLKYNVDYWANDISILKNEVDECK